MDEDGRFYKPYQVVSYSTVRLQARGYGWGEAPNPLLSLQHGPRAERELWFYRQCAALPEPGGEDSQAPSSSPSTAEQLRQDILCLRPFLPCFCKYLLLRRQRCLAAP